VTFGVEVIPSRDYAVRVALHFSGALPERGAVVITGGNTVGPVYEHLARMGLDWTEVDVFFSDERCVPPDDDNSNFKMADRTLLSPAGIRSSHRIRGEDEPGLAARSYEKEVRTAVERGFDVVLLGMGADAHIAGLFPGSPAISERSALCAAVDRPDGMKGVTLTPPALLAARKMLLAVTGAGKAPAVARALQSDEDARDCPVRLLAAHPDVTFLLDEGAAAHL
jgi:6-phosphogluconolactonase